MPLYEYQCGRCGRFERIQKFSDPALTVCPTCGEPVQKLLSAPAIQFKGTGWYITDYARKSGGDGGSAGAGTKDGSTPTSASSTKESKDSTKESKDSSSPQNSTSKDSAASGSRSTK